MALISFDMTIKQSVRNASASSNDFAYGTLNLSMIIYSLITSSCHPSMIWSESAKNGTSLCSAEPLSLLSFAILSISDQMSSSVVYSTSLRSVGD